MSVEINVFSDRAALKLFGSPQCWDFISSFQPRLDHDSADETERGKFKQWMGQHRDAHPFYEVLLAVGGTAWYGVGDSVFQCRPGTMVIIGPNQLHASRYRPADDGLNHIWVSFITPEQAFLQFVLVRHGKIRWVHDERSLINVGELSHLLCALHTLAAGDSPTKSMQTRLLLTAFFAELVHLIVETSYRPAGMINREALIRKKITMICEHIRKIGGNATLTDLALLAGYTPSHFARVFKQITGQTVHQYIDVCRIERVKTMLSQKVPLKIMAAELGFSDKTTMSRWLNKYRRAMVP